MRRQARSLCAALLWVGLLTTIPPSRAAQVTPVWQPQLSRGGLDADPRLERVVSLSLPDSDLGTVISHLTALSQAPLACDEDLRARPITVYLPPTRLKDVMAELAAFTACEWWTQGDPAGYQLRKTSALRKAEADALARFGSFDLMFSPEADPETVKAATHRLREYREALSVPVDQLVERYGDSDPWLVACRLNPLYQGLLPFLTSLSDRDVRLMTVRHLYFRVADLPTGLRDHLERAARGEFQSNDYYGPRPFHPDPGSVTLYRTWQERWDHATINLSWESGGVCIRFSVPDTHMSTPVLPIRAKEGNRASALQQIFRRTHPTPTVEEIKASIAKLEPVFAAEARQQEQEEASKMDRERLSALRKVGADWSDKETLDRHVIPCRNLPDSVSLGEVLVNIAEQAAIPLLAECAQSRSVPAPPELRKEQTVREALERSSRHWRSSAGWSKPLGRFATLKEEGTIPSFALSAHWGISSL